MLYPILNADKHDLHQLNQFLHLRQTNLQNNLLALTQGMD
jgi:hypothetical protein